MFPSDEDALEFLEDYDLDEARVKLLMGLGRVLEAAEIHAQNGDVLKAAEILTASAAQNIDHVQPAMNYLLTGLRWDFTLGMLPTSSSTASKLLRLADRLDKNAMTEQEIDEVCLPRTFNQRVLHLTPPACDV